ncbi:hypothetical protein TUBRATIS_009730 [Tubulinosema ratisbonensis]|uniref:5'-3' DNA helicase ZGRF1-like N-terminal domain-containing protein n=1 Tax=Tubulinosema ratisbonensis TaxID=291195 RepID=A0A437AMT4_9MICR|nr:hypothetical protein TUBRATIS_009730 [Tubulinosema ratisbonensis]
MYPCIYTKDILKKSKKWLEGFITQKNTKLTLLDENKKVIFAKQMNIKESEFRFGCYLVYAEEFVEEKCQKNNLTDQSDKKIVIEKKSEIKSNENNVRNDKEILEIIDELCKNK